MHPVILPRDRRIIELKVIVAALKQLMRSNAAGG